MLIWGQLELDLPFVVPLKASDNGLSDDED